MFSDALDNFYLNVQRLISLYFLKDLLSKEGFYGIFC